MDLTFGSTLPSFSRTLGSILRLDPFWIGTGVVLSGFIGRSIWSGVGKGLLQGP